MSKYNSERRYKNVGVVLTWAGRALKERKNVLHSIMLMPETGSKWWIQGIIDDRILTGTERKKPAQSKDTKIPDTESFSFPLLQYLQFYSDSVYQVISIPPKIPRTYFHAIMCVFLVPPTGVGHSLFESAGSSRFYLELTRRLLCQPLDAMFYLIKEAKSAIVNQEMLLSGFYLFIMYIKCYSC